VLSQYLVVLSELVEASARTDFNLFNGRLNSHPLPDRYRNQQKELQGSQGQVHQLPPVAEAKRQPPRITFVPPVTDYWVES
jgi:hypothetical protein